MDKVNKIKELEFEIYEKKRELAEYKRIDFPKEEIFNYSFINSNGENINLLELFGESDELIVVHNMGRACSYCTMWADGFNGVLKHIESRAAFAVISEDDYKTQESFAQQRGWNFNMVSSKGNLFFKDMGFKSDDGELHPGISTFVKSEDNRVYRTNATNLGPFDDFCSVWHIFAMLQSGNDIWQPKITY